MDARGVRIWTYQDLLSASDVVAVVEPTANENNSDSWEWIPKFAQGVTTTFHVLCYLKGDASSPDTIRVKHFLYKNVFPPNGGELIDFPLTAYNGLTDANKDFRNAVENAHHLRWLAFLKKADNGTYSPTSGQIDPAFSFLALHDAFTDHTIDGMVKPSK